MKKAQRQSVFETSQPVSGITISLGYLFDDETALFGVFIQNGVIMISHINIMRKRGVELKEAVISGASHRLRPVLMTATVAVLGLLPASLSTGIGSDVQRPLATVIVYGLLFGTILTLYILPALYYIMEKGKSTQTTAQ